MSSQATSPSVPRITPRKIDEYGNIPFADEKARLDNFAIELQRDAESMGHIIAYAGRLSCPGEAQARAVRAKKYLMEKRGIKWDRVMWKDGGYREELTVELWATPRGATWPSASPTVDPSEMRVRKNCRGKARRRGEHHQ